MKNATVAVGLLATALTAMPLAPASAEPWHHGGWDHHGGWGHRDHDGGLIGGLVGAAATLVAAPFIIAGAAVASAAPAPVYAEPAYAPQPVYAQPTYVQQPVYAQPVYAAPAPVVYGYPGYYHPRRVVVYSYPGYPGY